ncbi:MAG: helix-turn-helix domain-containing protein, partial [Thermoproteota archaeon]
TEKQENVLWLSLKMGYFDTPRKIGTRELAKTLGIVPSTFSEITRSGIRKLLEKYFESKTF